MLPVYDLSSAEGRGCFDKCLHLLGQTSSATGDAAKAVTAIIEEVKSSGDEAVVRYMQQWTDPDFDVNRIQVSSKELAAALQALNSDLRSAIEVAIDHARQYQEHIRPDMPPNIMIDGADLGLRFNPVDSVGLTVPGGSASLFSTVIMLGVPAIAAGVGNISVVSPPPNRTSGQTPGDISPVVLATCALLEIDKVYRIGGAQAVAALALGTQRVERVSMIAGPGNIYSQLAKQQLAGLVGTDGGFYGPSEIVVIADEKADARFIAADLLAQAEHDPGKCFLVAWSRQVIDQVIGQISRQVTSRKRRSAIESALGNESCAVLVADCDQAIRVADHIACEHVVLAVADPNALVMKLRHAGAIFLGDRSPMASGDYYAGPSHCLPTGRSARFASGISVYTFLKRTSTVGYQDGMNSSVIENIARMAEAEGLDAHAESARWRSR